MNLLEEKVESAVAFNNILFATDFSAVSEAALPYIVSLSLRYGSTMHVAHVLPDALVLRPGAPDPAVIGSIYEDAHSGAQEKMQQLAKNLRGFPHRTYIRHGHMLECIMDIIREQGIDLLVLGTHGRTGLGRLIMGSAAEELFRSAPCPVLTVGPRVPAMAKVVESRHDHNAPPANIKFHQILYATDLKVDAAESAVYAASLARQFQTEMALMHVMENFGEDLHKHPGPIDLALGKIEAIARDFEGLRYQPECLVKFGSPAEQILQTANEYQADLIVLGVRPPIGRMATLTHFGNSVAHKVVVGATCPVLTVRG